ncbi:substrate-binding domain-containing protein [Anabaena subtropica]|uniref:Substrate-binding domain-containing protein n=1 Tax=Anabaena subtropica FACHB-260 TaxID=2692884 RepID=A0ABR8CML2_9NOST|nr:substrate-binding domain-containing protein [Anabaena subtropica]MBD2343798.1 substrate-binding domain-containing protein [Anabaena subtropica FACHB-260]
MAVIESFYREYPCSYNAPLNCDRPLQTAQQIQGAKFCLECGFPATLPQEAEIKGSRGSYQITQFLSVRGRGRLYSAIQLKDKQPVIIKEYLLPNRCFNQEETTQRQETFKRIGGVNLADGRIQNFRLVQTWEAIADEKGERCYLITKDTKASQTLKQYLTENGAMTPSQMREFLNQALQTLVFLHTQKLRFPSNQIQQGLTHGNINLDSILIKIEKNQQFYIYFCDLAIWENLFIPSAITFPDTKKPEQDLEALGLVGFYLWVGRTTNYSSGQLLDPKESQICPNNDNYLKQFLYRLMGLDQPFENAESARQALLKLPQANDINNLQQSSAHQETENSFRSRIIWLIILALLLLAGGIWYYFWQRQPSDENKYLAWNSLIDTFSDVSNVPPGKFTYTGEINGTWSSILKERPSSERRLQDLLTKPKPEVEATFNYQEVQSKNLPDRSQPIEEVRNGQKYFAITSLADQITDDLDRKQVSYDGLLVFVAFNKKNFNLPQALDGNITLEQLRQIYTGKITNWRQINTNLPNLVIQPYVPNEPEAIHQFQRIVIGKNAQDIALFAEIIKKIPPESTETTQNRIRTARGQATGIIGFGVLSKTWNQCSGYPLAIVDSNNQTSQPLFRLRENRPIKPSDDLCDKANYFDVETFQIGKTSTYPLGYPLYVVYPKDDSRRAAGSTFADLLKTRQGQCLLNKVGIVPLQPMPDYIIRNSYACKSLP